MSTRSIGVLVLAVVCGLSAAVVLGRLHGTGEAATVETRSVLLATVDIPRGEMIKAESLTVAEWPTAVIPANALTKVEEAADRATAVPILKGDLVLEGKLASKDAGRGVAALIPKGMRAYTIQTAKIASNVAGFVLPGNRVDVLLTLRSMMNDDTGGGSTTTILQAVEILAINQRLDAPAENRIESKDLQSVTLLVTPPQAELLDLGQNLGTLTLSLRNLTDSAQSTTDPATLATLLHLRPTLPPALGGFLGVNPFGQTALKPPTAESKEPKEPKEPKPTWTIRTLRGSTPGEVIFEQR